MSLQSIAAEPPVPTPQSTTHYQDVIRPILMETCSECHSPGDDEDPVRFLRSTTPDEVAQQRGIWASVAEQLRNRTMPPADSTQPSEEQRVETADWIQRHLVATACDAGPYAGSPVARRLNRDQYTYAIKDLTGAEFDFVQKLPADGSGGEGFDNNGETLFLPPILMERYLELAQQIIDEVIVTDPLETIYVIESKANDQQPITFIPIASNESRPTSSIALQPMQTATITLTIPTEDDFGLSIKAIHTDDESQNLNLSIDGLAVSTLAIKKIDTAGDNGTNAHWTRVHLARGVHQIGLSVPAESAAMQIPWVRIKQDTGDKNERHRRERITKKIFAPAGDSLDQDHVTAARKTVKAFARKAWRRPITDNELAQLMALYDRGVARGEPMAQAIKLPMKAILVSPKFLFVVEKDAVDSGIHRVTDLELATRLSLFLWHSLPDDELLSLAADNKLHHRPTLHQQIRRLLADDRSERFAKAFSGQWLGTVAVGRTVIPDTNHFKPVYTTDLVLDLRRQVAETMSHMLKQNRPLTDWIDCDYAVVNKRLAKHYEMTTVPKSNDRFEVVALADTPQDQTRAGALGMGAVHMLTSYSRRTSPVLRGGWVLETMFGVHLPAPPPDAGALPGGEKESRKETVRQRLQSHRDNPTCAACHDLIDPIGFALENFDVLGRWRDKEGKLKIDALGKLPSGQEFTGPAELRKVLLDRQDNFLQQIARRMLGYALGRSLEDADQCTVTQLTKRLRDKDAKIHELIIGIVESVPFQNRQK
ncbi:DUF1592 domain-containing protein [Stieleria marina]